MGAELCVMAAEEPFDTRTATGVRWYGPVRQSVPDRVPSQYDPTSPHIVLVTRRDRICEAQCPCRIGAADRLA